MLRGRLPLPVPLHLIQNFSLLHKSPWWPPCLYFHTVELLVFLLWRPTTNFIPNLIAC